MDWSLFLMIPMYILLGTAIIFALVCIFYESIQMIKIIREEKIESYSYLLKKEFEKEIFNLRYENTKLKEICDGTISTLHRVVEDQQKKIDELESKTKTKKH